MGARKEYAVSLRTILSGAVVPVRKKAEEDADQGGQSYSKGDRPIEVASATAGWNSPSLPAVPLRSERGLANRREEEFDTQASFLCTDLTAELLRWSAGWPSAGGWTLSAKRCVSALGS
jgi:hypothetical protein